MKQENNNEIDLLLRRLGRRPDAFVPEAGSRIAGEHLDADELNSYAENALPAAARSRYTEHLAECASCRELVVRLSSSAGVVVAAEKSRSPEPSGFRKFLASLFSPMVLRYAGPALGLVIVAAIGFVVLRRENPAEFIAMDPRKAAGTNAPMPAQSTSPSNAGPSGESRGVISPQKDNAGRVQQPVVTDAPAAAPAPVPTPGEPAGAGAGAGEGKQASPTDKIERPAEQQPLVTVAPATAGAKSVAQDAKKQVANEPPPTTESARERAYDSAAKLQESQARRAERQVTAAAPTSAGSVQRDGVDEKEKADAETRTVAGRRFRRQGGVWIDTAYDSSRDTVNLTRGSEQYRALIADEPAIKTFADALDGQLIVVWKGRAYRIR